MSKALNDAGYTTDLLPVAGSKIPQQPASGAMHNFDAGVINNLRNAHAPRCGVALNGSASTGKLIRDITGQTPGADPFTLNVVWRPPASTDTKGLPNGGLVMLSGSSSYGSAAATSFTVGTANSTDKLIFDLYGATLSDWNEAQCSILGWEGKWVMITIVRPASGNLAVYFNGVAQTLTFTTGGSAPGWQGNVTGQYLNIGFLNGSGWQKGIIGSFSIYNLGLTPADIIDVYELNGAIPWRFQSGSQTALYTSDFSAGVDIWSATTGTTIAGNVDGIGGQNDNLSSTFTSASGDRGVQPTVGQQLARDKVYRFKASAYIPSATTTKTIRMDDSVDGECGTAESSGATTQVLSADTWTALSWLLTLPNSATMAIRIMAGTTSDIFYLRAISWVQVGAVLHWACDDGIGLMLADQSSNKLHGIIQVNNSDFARFTIPKGTGRLRFTTNTNGNQQILGQQCLPANSRIRSWVIDSAGTPTVKLGNASAGGQFLAAVAVASGLNDMSDASSKGPLLTRFCSTNNLWVNSTTTDALQHTIDYEVVD